MVNAIIKVEVHLANTASSQALHWNNHKQITKLHIKKVNNPNWRGANQLAIYMRGPGVKLWTTKKQIQPVVGAELELGTSVDASSTR